MEADSGGVACASWRWFWKRCLGVTMMIVILVASLMAGTMLSAVFFQAVDL